MHLRGLSTWVCCLAVLVYLHAPLRVARAAKFKPNYDDKAVPNYTLPDPLVMANGQPVKTAKDWSAKRRPELLRLFETNLYGRAPEQKPNLTFAVTSQDSTALGGKAIRKEVTITIVTRRGQRPLRLLLYAPKSAKAAPAFIGLNFVGNQAIQTDPGITLGKAWVRRRPEFGIDLNHATEASRGAEASRWQVEEVVARGYAVATMCCGDIEPDSPDGIASGLRPLFYRDGQTEPDADEWGAIAAWAWGLSRALDYLETEPLVDARRVAVWGHSRLGKTALWAGATDRRFALVISNDSGCLGAALSRRAFGETVARINSSFPYWFCRNCRQFNNNESELPVDQHELIALAAPRPIYIASAEEDSWADPRGEFLAAKNAEPVYHLYGLSGLGAEGMPLVNHPIGKTIGYHIRTGKHDATAYDWQQYLAFADRHLRMESKSREQD